MKWIFFFGFMCCINNMFASDAAEASRSADIASSFSELEKTLKDQILSVQEEINALIRGQSEALEERCAALEERVAALSSDAEGSRYNHGLHIRNITLLLQQNHWLNKKIQEQQTKLEMLEGTCVSQDDRIRALEARIDLADAMPARVGESHAAMMLGSLLGDNPWTSKK